MPKGESSREDLQDLIRRNLARAKAEGRRIAWRFPWRGGGK
jgi:hypothetical protein